MGQVFDYTAAGPVLQQRYEKNKKVQTGFFQDRPFLADVPKDENSGGAAFNFAVKMAAMSTRAYTVPNALANGAADQYVTFNVPTLYNDYAIVQLSLPAVDNASGSENALVDLLVEAFDGAHDTAYESQSLQLFGNGGGARGQLSANQTLSSTTLTLQAVGDAVNFWKGQVLQSSVDDGTGGGGVRSGTVTVQGVDYQAGTVLLTGALNAGIPNVAASDYLFMFGDYSNGFKGLAAYNPTAAPTSALFLGVDRTQNIVGLSGWRVIGNGAAYEDSLTDICARMCSIGAKPNRIYLNPIDWASMAKTQNSKVIYDRGQTKAFSTPELMFESLKFVTPKGPADIVADVGMKQGYGRVVQLDQLKLMSNGKICRPSTNWQNLQWLPSYTDDVIQTRLVSRSFLVCNRPAALGVVTF